MKATVHPSKSFSILSGKKTKLIHIPPVMLG
jgi:hypothetical protein